MRCSIVLCLVFAVAALTPTIGHAQTKDRLIIEKVRVGLPGGRKFEAGKYKAGFWTPIYVDLTTGPEDIPAGQADLVVETSDNDGLLNQYTQPLPALAKKQTISNIITYVRPGNFSTDITVTVRIAGRPYKKWQSAQESDWDRASKLVDTGGFLYLTLGSKLPGLQRALTARENQQRLGQEPNAQADDVLNDEDLMDNSNRRFVAIDQLELMPTHWFGYQAVDVMVLTSGNADFIKWLSADRSGRLDALIEWVRRGGRLIISAGHNQQFVDDLVKKTKLIKCDLTGTVTRQRLIGFTSVTSSPSLRFESPTGIEIAKIEPGVGVDLLDERLRERPDDRDKDERPLAVQGGAGLGHVILIACDLDSPPFTAWKGQGDFWRFLQSRVEPRQTVADESGHVFGGRMPQGMMSDTNELAGQLQNGLEKFGDITVISFGWVALFILIYIIIVGPLDYLFLKKVVKRLELTWITFPAVVLVVSAAAYFTAYYLKGNDLKINKLDVVDIDLTPAVDAKEPPPRVYGSTWFTLFSPRIQHYTIGLEHARDWGGGNGTASTLVGWMARPGDVFGGTGRAGSPSLFRRTYEYTDDVSGLKGVPIQVWATKSFEASWVAPPSADDRVPFTAAEIRHPPGAPEFLIGSVTNNLPVDLVDVAVLYKGFAYPQGRLDAGVPKRIDVTAHNRKGSVEWMNEPFGGTRWSGSLAEPDMSLWSAQNLKRVFFHGKRDANLTVRNTNLRHLDQGWRLEKEREEVVLVGQVDPRSGDGPAEKVSLDGISPSLLWLGDLPGTSKRTPLEGTMTQRTFVRVYIPVIPQAH